MEKLLPRQTQDHVTGVLHKQFEVPVSMIPNFP